MVIRWSPTVLDNNIAPGVSQLTRCDAPDLSASHPEAPHWLANHFLSNALIGRMQGSLRQYYLNIIFRAQTCFNKYHDARRLTIEFLDSGTALNPAISKYFLAIAEWESCFLNVQIFIDLLNKVDTREVKSPIFLEGDGSAEQRAYGMANSIKHWGSDLSKSRHSEEHTIPLWLSNEGFHTRLHGVTFSELAEIITGVAMLADDIQNPSALIQKQKGEER